MEQEGLDEHAREHSRRLHRLARRLLSDPSAAEDVVQETWIAALKRAQRSSLPSGAWMLRVLRNLVYQGHRREAFRRERIQNLVRELPPNAAQDLAGLDDCDADRLNAALATLTPEQREAIALRFGEGLPPRSIARRLGMPVKTVDSRLARGLARLRAQLGRRRDSRRLAPAAFCLGSRAQRARVWTSRMAWSALAIACAGLVAALLVLRRAGAPPTSALAAVPTPSNAPVEALVRSSTDSAGRSALANQPAVPLTPTTVGSDPPDEAPHWVRYSGRVVSTDGAPVGGAEVVFRAGRMLTYPNGVRAFALESPQSPEHTCAADENGRFELDVPPTTSGRLAARGSGWSPLTADLLVEDPSRERVLFVAPHYRVRGRVRFEDGSPVAGAQVRLDAPAEFWDLLPPVSGAFVPVEPFSTTDRAGRFELPGGYCFEGARAIATRGDLAPTSIELTRTGETLEIVIARPAPAGTLLVGRVFDGDGDRPAPYAWVSCGGALASADENGVFRLELDDNGRWAPIQAVALGRGSTTIYPATESGWMAGAPPVALRVRKGVRGVSGRVLDAGGHPVPGARVWIVDPTPFHPGTPPLLVEQLLQGSFRPLDKWYREADGEGRFRIDGLDGRNYHVQAAAPGTLRKSVAVLLRDSADEIDLVLAQEETARVEGVVRAVDGTPLSHVRIVPRVQLLEEDGAVEAHLDAPELGTTSGVDGRFSMAGLPLGQEIELVLSGPSILTSATSVRLVEPLVQRDFVGVRPAWLEVERAPDAEAVSLVLRGENEEVLLAYPDVRSAHAGLKALPRIRLGAGTARVVAPENARWLEIHSPHGIDRSPIELRPLGTLRVSR
jgi:RNA polymerase sigma-70 factor (ECF subfamily)